MDACHLHQKKVEFRPTDRAVIKLPLSVHPKSGKMCWYVEAASVKETCTPDYLLGIEPLDAREQQAVFSFPLLSPAKHALGAEAAGGGGARSSAETRRLGTTLAQAGTRHNMMRNIAVFERTRGSSKEVCRKRLEEWYAGQDRSLIRSTPAQVIRTWTSWLHGSIRSDSTLPAMDAQEGPHIFTPTRWRWSLHSRHERRGARKNAFRANCAYAAEKSGRSMSFMPTAAGKANRFMTHGAANAL